MWDLGFAVFTVSGVASHLIMRTGVIHHIEATAIFLEGVLL